MKETTKYDLVLLNGRVIDPKTRMNQVSNIGIRSGTITTIVPPSQQIEGRTAIDASGCVVAPGFIDIHAHEDCETIAGIQAQMAMQIIPKSPLEIMKCRLLDGTTTMIGGNCGASVHPLEKYFNTLEHEGCLINYASYCGQLSLREEVGLNDRYANATAGQIEKMKIMTTIDMKAGALGVSYGLMYSPGVSYAEMLALAHIAAKYGGITAAHARAAGNVPEALGSLNEMIQLARDSTIGHQYSHIGSMAAYGEYMNLCIEAMNKAQTEGLRIFADIYPYCAWSTGLGSAILDDGFFERYECNPGDLEVPRDILIDDKTIMHRGDRFTPELFTYIRGLVLNGTITDPLVIGHTIKRDKVKLAMANPYVMIGSDGAIITDSETRGHFGHPRTSGTYGKFLGEYVRQEAVMDLVTALYKCSTLPAEILGMKSKGRLSVGADADIAIFNAETVIDRATFGSGFMKPTDGIRYVIVNGITAVKDGQLVSNIMPGKIIRRTWEIPKNLAEQSK